MLPSSRCFTPHPVGNKVQPWMCFWVPLLHSFTEKVSSKEQKWHGIRSLFCFFGIFKILNVFCVGKFLKMDTLRADWPGHTMKTFFLVLTPVSSSKGGQGYKSTFLTLTFDKRITYSCCSAPVGFPRHNVSIRMLD